MNLADTLQGVFQHLLTHYGPQHWWPGDGPWEVMVGAILTQNTNWKNVEKAIANLKQAQALTPHRLRQLPVEELKTLIRPAGYFNAKAAKLKALAAWIEKFNDDLPQALSLELPQLRQELLSIYGIGPETADSIVLYAAQKPTFVIDAYTHRILTRLGLVPSGIAYSPLQLLFADNMPPDTEMFNEYHALLVHHGKETCRPSPLCSRCCLLDLCSFPDKTTL